MVRKGRLGGDGLGRSHGRRARCWGPIRRKINNGKKSRKGDKRPWTSVSRAAGAGGIVWAAAGDISSSSAEQYPLAGKKRTNKGTFVKRLVGVIAKEFVQIVHSIGIFRNTRTSCNARLPIFFFEMSRNDKSSSARGPSTNTEVARQRIERHAFAMLQYKRGQYHFVQGTNPPFPYLGPWRHGVDRSATTFAAKTVKSRDRWFESFGAFFFGC